MDAETADGLSVYTLGGFRVTRSDLQIPHDDWGRTKALHLFQFLVTHRHQPMLKEQIIYRLWPALDEAAGDRDFKVALNTVYRTIEPDRPPRAAPRFIQRRGRTYQLQEEVWVDADSFESGIVAGTQALPSDPEEAIQRLQEALPMYKGPFLPERRYEDWSSAERERLQTLALSAFVNLARLVLPTNPTESLRLAERTLKMEPLWEDAYRVKMLAHHALGNRAMAVKTYRQCVAVLDRELGVPPLPDTRELYEQILQGEL